MCSLRLIYLSIQVPTLLYVWNFKAKTDIISYLSYFKVNIFKVFDKSPERFTRILIIL